MSVKFYKMCFFYFLCLPYNLFHRDENACLVRITLKETMKRSFSKTKLKARLNVVRSTILYSHFIRYIQEIFSALFPSGYIILKQVPIRSLCYSLWYMYTSRQPIHRRSLCWPERTGFGANPFMMDWFPLGDASDSPYRRYIGKMTCS